MTNTASSFAPLAPINFQAYGPLARRTLRELPFFEHLEHMALGFVGEIGELIDARKKTLAYGKLYDLVNFKEELGDVAWYIVNLAPELGIELVELDAMRAVMTREAKADQRMLQLPESTLLMTISVAFSSMGMQLVDRDSAAQFAPSNPGRSQACTRVMQGLVAYLCMLAGRFDVNLEEVFAKNIDKLAGRFGDKFSEQAATLRDLAAERRILEADHSGNVLADGGPAPAGMPDTPVVPLSEDGAIGLVDAVRAGTAEVFKDTGAILASVATESSDSNTSGSGVGITD